MDLYDEDFREACRRLAERVAAFDPDLLVGIATGGLHVAEAMQPYLPGTKLLSVRLQRPGTVAKDALHLSAAVRRLPRRLADVLRWCEVEYREATLRREVPSDLADRAARLASESGLHTATRYARVVVVDDTIDSGRTLRLATAAVALAHPESTIWTAVLASTWCKPPVQPDVCLYDRTLLRMPWSLDAQPVC